MTARILTLLLALAAPSAAEETFYYVDPVQGVDIPTAGRFTQPWKSITYALSQPLDPQARINLFPGDYTVATGEVFPIELNPLTIVVGFYGCGARVIQPAGSTVPAFRWTVQPGRGGYGDLWDMTIETDHRAVEVIVGADANFSFSASGLRVSGNQAVHIALDPGANVSAYVNGSDLATTLAPVIAEVSPGSATLDTRLDLDVNRSRLTASSGSAVEGTVTGPGAALVVGGTSSVLYGCESGVDLTVSGGGTASTMIENFVFYGLASGAVSETASTLSPLPTHDLRNSIFWGNAVQQDLPGYDPARYTLTTNLFEDAALVGIGGSIAGPPDFVDAAAGDWHLLPSSPARDAGSPSPDFDASDLDGDPRMTVFGGDGITDVGADELYERYVYFTAPPGVGQVATLRVFGVAGDDFAVFVGPMTFFPGFGDGLQLHSVFFPAPLLAGVVAPSGLSEGQVPVPADGALLGIAYMAQAVYLSGGALEFSANAYKNWICE